MVVVVRRLHRDHTLQEWRISHLYYLEDRTFHSFKKLMTVETEKKLGPCHRISAVIMSAVLFEVQVQINTFTFVVFSVPQLHVCWQLYYKMFVVFLC